MKKTLIKTLAVIVIVTIAAMAFTACTRKTNAAVNNTANNAEITDDSFNVLGEWRYVTSRSTINGDLYEEERLSYPATSVLSILQNYEDEVYTEIFSYAGMYTYYGVLTKRDNHTYHFNAGYVWEIGSGYTTQINETYIFIYDPVTGSLGWDEQDLNLIRYYERAGQTGAAEYKIGDTGPAGGFIFYDKGYLSDGWRYLEAAPANTEFRTGWGAFGNYVDGTETGVGTGKRNTELILEYLYITGETEQAAQLCNDLNVNGFSDWFLPSSDELALMHSNGLGGLSDAWDAWWWSSSQHDSEHAWYLNSFGGLFNNVAKPSTGSVRAARAF